MTGVELCAPAKLNLCLYVGPSRDDGLHEICSLFAPLVAGRPAGRRATPSEDEVSCPGVEGPDLTARALAALRAAGWWRGRRSGSRSRSAIPVAAGLGGGSADAAAALRLARGAVPEERLAAIARTLGADVSSQLDPALLRSSAAPARSSSRCRPRIRSPRC